MRIQDLIRSRNDWVQGTMYVPRVKVELTDAKTIVTSYYPNHQELDMLCLAGAVLRHGAQLFWMRIDDLDVELGRISNAQRHALSVMARVIQELFPERTPCACASCQDYAHQCAKPDLPSIRLLHIIEKFNDDPKTTFDMVDKVLHEYQHRVDDALEPGE